MAKWRIRRFSWRLKCLNLHCQWGALVFNSLPGIKFSLQAAASDSAAAYWPARTSGWLATNDNQKIAAELVVVFAALENARLIASICLKASFLDAFLGGFHQPDLLRNGFFSREHEKTRFWAVQPEFVREVNSQWSVLDNLVGLEAALAEQILEHGLPPITAVIDVDEISLNSPAKAEAKIRAVVKWAETSGVKAEAKGYATAKRIVAYAEAIKIVGNALAVVIVAVGLATGGNPGNDPAGPGGQEPFIIVCEFKDSGGGEATDEPGAGGKDAVAIALSELTDQWRQELGADDAQVPLKEMSTERVKAFQNALMAVDIKLPKHGADGIMGDETRNAAESYAKRSGFEHWDDNPGLLIEKLAGDAAFARWNSAGP